MTRPLSEALVDFTAQGPAETRVATFLAENGHQVATLSLDQIALRSGVSQPTVTRTALRLGYRNALELRTAAALETHGRALQPGSLAPDDILRAAELIAKAYNLYIYPARELVPCGKHFLNRISP